MDYLTVKSFAYDEFTERKSRFIGYIMPATTKEQAEKFISKIKSRNYDATHNVSAYILHDGNLEHCSDDGEPQGTAGVPVLDVLKKEKLTNVCVVVTRYFGGIMLGSGGLVRAYSKGCKIAVSAAEWISMRLCQRMTVEIDYTFYGKINHLLPDYNIKIEASDFSDKVTLQFLVPMASSKKITDMLMENTNAQVDINLLEHVFAEFPHEFETK